MRPSFKSSSKAEESAHAEALVGLAISAEMVDVALATDTEVTNTDDGATRSTAASDASNASATSDSWGEPPAPANGEGLKVSTALALT